MDLNASLLNHIDNIINDSIQLMNIEKPKGIITNENDFNSLAGKTKTTYKQFIKQTQRIKTNTLLGCYNYESDKLFLDIDKHDSISKLDQTIVHELTHKKFPKLKHGKKFDSFIESIQLKLIKCDHYFFKVKVLNLKDNKTLETNYCKKCMLEIKYTDVKINDIVKSTMDLNGVIR